METMSARRQALSKFNVYVTGVDYINTVILIEVLGLLVKLLQFIIVIYEGKQILD